MPLYAVWIGTKFHETELSTFLRSFYEFMSEGYAPSDFKQLQNSNSSPLSRLTPIVYTYLSPHSMLCRKVFKIFSTSPSSDYRHKKSIYVRPNIHRDRLP